MSVEVRPIEVEDADSFPASSACDGTSQLASATVSVGTGQACHITGILIVNKAANGGSVTIEDEDGTDLLVLGIPAAIGSTMLNFPHTLQGTTGKDIHLNPGTDFNSNVIITLFGYVVREY